MRAVKQKNIRELGKLNFMLKHRLLSGFLLFALSVALVFGHGLWAETLFVVLVAALICGALKEFFRLGEKISQHGYPILTMATGLLLLAAVVLEGHGRLSGAGGELFRVLLYTIFMGASFLLAFQARDLRTGIQGALFSFAGFFYLAWTLSWSAAIYYLQPENNLGYGLSSGPYLLLFSILVIKSGDIGGYILGMWTARRAQGNHKLVPRLSPKKSWEGLLGSLLFSPAAACLLLFALPAVFLHRGQPILSPMAAVLLGILAALVGLAGDLAESILKRAAEVKDSGETIPGMGGVLDLIDSLVLALPLFYVYLKTLLT